MSLFMKALREESESIRFDNLFTADIEKEQEFDLIFTAEQDDEDLKTIAGNSIMKEDGSEIETNIPDCIAVNEDGEVVDKDEEEEKDISSNDVDNNGVDDDAEAAEPVAQSGPSVVVNVDADDVNINAENDKTSFGEEGDVTVNANVANIMPTPPAAEPSTPPVAAVVTPAPVAEPEAVPVEDNKEEEEDVTVIDAEPDEEPAEAEAPAEDDPTPIDVDEVTETSDSEDSTPSEPEDKKEEENSDVEHEGVEEIISDDEFEELTSTDTSAENNPVDPSTEVTFSDNPEYEVSNDDGVNEMSLIEEDLGDPTLGDAPVNDGEIEEVEEPAHTDTSAYSALEKEPEEDTEDAMITTDDLELECDDDVCCDESSVAEFPGEDEMEQLAADDLAAIPPSITDGDLENMLLDSDDDPSKKTNGTVNDFKVDVADEATLIEEDEGFDDESKGEEDTADLKGEEVEESTDLLGEDTLEEGDESVAIQHDDNLSSAKDEKYEDDLQPVVDADVEKLLTDAPEDEVKEELDIDPVEPKDIPMNNGSVKEDTDLLGEDTLEEADETVAIQHDDNLSSAKDEKYEDDVKEITDADVEKILNTAPEDEVKEELGIDPVEPKDVPMNNGSVKEDTDLLDEDNLLEEDGEVEIIDAKDVAENDDLSPVGPSEIIPDEINAPEEDMEYDKVAAERLKEDYEEDVAMISTEDDFANVENDGLDHTPESEEPGSMEELIDDEVLEFVESEG